MDVKNLDEMIWDKKRNIHLYSAPVISDLGCFSLFRSR